MWLCVGGCALNMDYIQRVFLKDESIMYIDRDGTRYGLCKYESPEKAKRSFNAIWEAVTLGAEAVHVD